MESRTLSGGSGCPRARTGGAGAEAAGGAAGGVTEMLDSTKVQINGGHV